MATQHLESLGLDPGQVRNAIRFHRAYAETALAELESAGSDDADLAFTLRADAASALREAAQWALLLDPVPATRLLRRAGDQFLQLGQAFGAYLEVLAGGGKRGADPVVLAQALRDMSDRPRDDVEDEYQPMPEIRFQQQQQAYLVVAASAVATQADGRADADRAYSSRDVLGSALGENLETSAHSTGVLPVGSLGTPIHRFWSVARNLLGDSGQDVFEIARHLVAMCQAYEEAISLARANDYLWRNGAAPVDIADLDIAGISALTVRRFDGDRLEAALADATLGRGLSPIARVPFELGISLAGR
ncbi:hypothetical protein [Kutzneria sp. CA-103260]|uniref:hypothetical protein n=1 Tax=Kutzneria sp. CA-103260 TaxID=2802641 RepID=UPI001BA98751|nr:hypothetical protein [Kutzneria sp. CA-103260]QUQ65563.1 hypothetical protein JJ691_32870 [Kutzneria sp. CA-103260]